MPMTPDDVRKKEFTTVRLHMGYDMDEVDAFLDEVETELTRLTREHDELAAKASKAAAAPMIGPAPDPAAPAAASAASPQSDSAIKVLELAQRTADDTVAAAKTEAARLIAEAEEQHIATLGNLEKERADLDTQIADLRSFEREYRRRLRDYIEGQLREVDARPDDAAVPQPVQTA